MFQATNSWSVVQPRAAGNLVQVREGVIRKATGNFSHAMV